VSNFRPLPLLGNPHVQTILGNLLTGVRGSLRGRRRIVELPDGDRIVLHETPPRLETPGMPVALLVHGLGGSHRSTYMQRMTHRLIDVGWRVVRMDMRGAGAGVRLARRLYTAACSDDVRVVVESLVRAYPQSPLAIVGFSLGGNVVLKYAGEFADRMPSAVNAIVGVAPPIDLLRCSDLISQYPFYDRFYVRHLLQQVAQHERCCPDVPRAIFPREMLLRHFDEVYTAPRWGYADAVDYYKRASAFPFIPAIRVPAYILTSRDDPFVAVEPFEALQPAGCVTLRILDHGGHMGFLGLDGSGGIRWAETQLVAWLQQTVGAKSFQR
jgi:uncharacterized protein